MRRGDHTAGAGWLTPEEIQKCGMSMRKADNLSRIAHSVLGGETDLEHLHTLSDPEIVRVLSALARRRGVDCPDADDLCHGASGCHQL